MVGRFYLKSAGFIAKIGEVVRGQKNLLDDPSFHNNLEEQRFAARPVAGGVHPKTGGDIIDIYPRKEDIRWLLFCLRVGIVKDRCPANSIQIDRAAVFKRKEAAIWPKVQSPHPFYVVMLGDDFCVGERSLAHKFVTFSDGQFKKLGKSIRHIQGDSFLCYFHYGVVRRLRLR